MKDFSQNRPRRVIVIGGGIAGLMAAILLKRVGISVEVFERDDAVGGSIRTAFLKDRYLIEKGPQWFFKGEERVIRLIKDFGAESDLMTSEHNMDSCKVLWKKEIYNFPVSKSQFLKSSLFSLRERMKLLSGKKIKFTDEERTLASFVSENFGWEFFERTISPVVNANFGDVSQMSTSHIFSRIFSKNVDYSKIDAAITILKKFISFTPLNFRWGMATLPNLMSDVLSGHVFTHSTVESIERLVDGRLAVRLDGPENSSWADAVVVATPAWAAAQLTSNLLPELSAKLISFPYVSFLSVNLSYKKNDFKTDFPSGGLYIPREEGELPLAIFPSSQIFRNRAPKDEILFTCYLGGGVDPQVFELNEESLLCKTQSVFENHFGVESDPVFKNVTRSPMLIPQFGLGYEGLISAIKQDLKKSPGIFLAGGYMSGPSMGDVIDCAEKMSVEVLGYLASLRA